MAIDRVITGGKVATPEGLYPLDVLVKGEKIAGLVTPGTAPSDVRELIDAQGLLVMPGAVDVHVHTREPGYTHKEDITTCTQAAAAGGVTTIFGMPNLNPPTVSRASLDDVFSLYAAKSVVDYNHNPAATQLAEFPAMAEAGIAAYKIYMVVDTQRSYPHPAGTGANNHGHLLEIMEAVAPTGLPLMVHPHDQEIMDLIEQRWWAKGDRSPQAYAKTLGVHDGLIWDAAIAMLLRLSEATDCPLYICHTNTWRSINMIREAKAKGVRVTAEVNHWTLFLATWEDVERLGPYALSYWVSDKSREAVWEAVNDGTIDFLASDHAPHTREEKEVGWEDMWAAHSGTPGVQYQLPLALDAAIQGKVSVERVVEMASTAPARSFGLENKGKLMPGADADIVLVDLNNEWTITNGDVLSRIGWTPYDGRVCKARIVRTLLRGEDIYHEGKVVGQPGGGKLANPEL
jgi:dihydroorotase (multifunctional complex type)